MSDLHEKYLNPNKYKLIKKIGAGGLGVVYKCIDLETNKYVAIKFLHDKFLKKPKFLGIFHKELLINSEFHHKNIVKYLDNYFRPPNCYIVTDFISGWSGYSLLKKCKKFPPLVALAIIFDLLQGVDYIHLHDTAHSDLSTANFMINTTGRVLITDFGLSCKLNVEDYKEHIVGTPGYYAPEHISQKPINVTSDIYCIGLLIYELIVGKKAVAANSNHAEVEKNMRAIKFDLIETSIPKMTKPIQKIVSQCLEYEPQKRIPSAEILMFKIYDILKKYKIKYTRLAIAQFLIESGYVKGTIKKKQDIYIGQIENEPKNS